ncbi:MAG: DUF1585 domain-containing protein [Myxococcota bacterium]
MILALALACASPEAPDAAPAWHVEASAPRLLRRMALDLRGELPTLEELDAVEADPAALAGLRDDMLDDPALEDRLVSFLAERWHTRVDAFDAPYYDFGLSQDQAFTYAASIGEEPLRLAANLVVNDRPWTDVVSADHTMANEMLADIWPIDYPEGGEGWQESRYTDDRPAAGVLATNGLWWRYTTSTFNNNRTRAAALFRLLLCEDFLARPVSFSASGALSSGTTSEEAIRSEPYCVACHVSIDPVAALFFGFSWQAQYSAIEMSTYHAEREPIGESTLGVEPAWFGEPVYGLVDLGDHIAADPRFHQCAAETMAAALWRREVEIVDFDRVEAFRDAYEAEGYSMKALLRAVTDDPVYRADALAADAPEDVVAREIPVRLLSVDQLASAARDLSGFTWRSHGADLLADDTTGYRVLGGGVNGVNVTRPQQEPGLTWALVVERLAQATAYTAVTDDFAEGADRRLFRHATLDTRPGDAAFAAELRDLHWRLHAERPDDARIADTTALWEAVAAESDASTAWIAVLTVLLRDPAYVTH